MPLISRMKIVHLEDPVEAILREVGDLTGIEPLNQQVLVAIYIRPATQTTGGVYIPETVTDEDRFQSKVGLVLKRGPRAFVDDGPVKFYGFKLGLGDWAVFRPSDGIKMQIGERDCRLIPDVHFRCKLQHPDQVY